MTNMKYRELGRTGIQVSEVGLGCEHLQGMEYEAVEAVIREALDLGINVMDVFMSEPQVRTNLGNALKGRREEMVIQGHLGAIWEDGQYARSRDISKVKEFFQDFLQRFHTDYVDIGMIHFVDEQEDLDVIFNGEVLEYAKELKKNGVIRAIGLSSHNPQVAKRAVESGVIDVLMFSINPAYDLLPDDIEIDALFTPETFQNGGLTGTHPGRAALYETCERMGTAITVMKTLGAGTLLSAEQSPFGVALSAAQCMHYALTRPAVASVLIGCRTPEQVREAASYENAAPEERDYSVVLSSTPKYSARGRCMYCNHCLPCPSEIDIAMVNKYLDLASASMEDSVKSHYLLLKRTGSDCVSCGSCEERCPFGVPVIQRMARAAELFER